MRLLSISTVIVYEFLFELDLVHKVNSNKSLYFLALKWIFRGKVDFNHSSLPVFKDSSRGLIVKIVIALCILYARMTLNTSDFCQCNAGGII